MERCLDAWGVAGLAASRTVLSKLVGLLSTRARLRIARSVASAVNNFNQSTSPQVFANINAYTTKMTDLELQSQETEALLKTSERPKKRALAIQIIALCGAAALAGAALASRAGPRDVAVTRH